MAGVVGLLWVLAACGGLDEASTASAPSRSAAPAVGATDFSRAEVPLDEIIFDTFDGGSFPLEGSDPAQVAELLDAIAPINAPRYQPADQAGWLDDDDLVIGFVGDDGSAYAYPHRILNSHELVAEEVDGVPLVITFCPLCRSGVVFDRRVNHPDFSGVLEFSNTSALYNNDLVMIDRQTGTYWWQVAGRGIVGTLTGAELEILPSETRTWQHWQTEHPESQVLSRDQGFGRTYNDGFGTYADSVNRGDTPFPVEPDVLADERLPSAALVVGVEVGDRAVDDRPPGPVPLPGTNIVVTRDGASGASVVATETGQAYPSRSSFWFAYLASFRQAEIIDPQ
jgi:hypothetical protein